jgi:hypothetical protein
MTLTRETPLAAVTALCPQATITSLNLLQKLTADECQQLGAFLGMKSDACYLRRGSAWGGFRPFRSDESTAG